LTSVGWCCEASDDANRESRSDTMSMISSKTESSMSSLSAAVSFSTSDFENVLAKA
jgi:hypothetical protein